MLQLMFNPFGGYRSSAKESEVHMTNLILNNPFGITEKNGIPVENWVEFQGTEGRYNISDAGRVMNNRTGKILKPQLSGKKDNQYQYVAIYYHSVKQNHKIHREVARHFIPNPFNLPEVNHKDGNKINNFANNLEWCTPSYNNKHAYSIGLRQPNQKVKGISNGRSKLSEIQIKEIRKRYSDGNTKYKLSKEYNVSWTTISHILNGKLWSHVI
jgi:hypothetical protein